MDFAGQLRDSLRNSPNQSKRVLLTVKSAYFFGDQLDSVVRSFRPREFDTTSSQNGYARSWKAKPALMCFDGKSISKEYVDGFNMPAAIKKHERHRNSSCSQPITKRSCSVLHASAIPSKNTIICSTMKFCGLIFALCGTSAAFVIPSGTLGRKATTLSAGSDSYYPAPGLAREDSPYYNDQSSLANGGVMLTPADQRFYEHVTSMGPPQRIQGGALRTWSFDKADRLIVGISSDDRTLQNDVLAHEGRHMKCLLELCEGPDNTPFRLEVVSGKGKLRPFKAVIETPKGYGSLFLRNIGDLEFPITANVGAAHTGGGGPFMDLDEDIYDMRAPEMLQGGGSIISFPLDPQVRSAKVQLRTDGRPLNAKIELIQGPNTIRYSIDLYNEDGNLRQFYTVISTPNAGNVIRIVNTAPVEYPLTVAVEPFEIEDKVIEIVTGEKPLFKVGGV